MASVEFIGEESASPTKPKKVRAGNFKIKLLITPDRLDDCFNVHDESPVKTLNSTKKLYNLDNIFIYKTKLSIPRIPC